LENYQTENGLTVPEVLRPFVGVDFIPYKEEEKKEEKKEKPAKNQPKKEGTKKKEEASDATHAETETK
jgi:hypothetical protein